MEMISEKTIDEVLARFESGQLDYEKSLRNFAGRQPALMAFLLADTEGALTEAEQELLLYLATVIFLATEAAGIENDKVTADQVAEAEEANWNQLGQSKARSFRERLDAFFDQTNQEDLLAFVEDSLATDDAEEDEITVTPEGREPMFVSLKTVIDVLVE